MKSSRAFWGTLLLIIGVLGLLHNFFSVYVDWSTLWKFWPLILVLLGVTAFMKDSRYRWVIISAIGIIVGVVAFSVIQRGCSNIDHIIHHEIGYIDDDDDGWSHDTVEQQFSEDFDSLAQKAVFEFNAGAGSFMIDDTTSAYLDAEIKSSMGAYTLDREQYEGIDYFDLSMRNKTVRWKGGHFKNRVHLSFNTEPVWDFRFDIGAASVDFDLSPYLVREIDIDAGAASMDLTLGNRSDTTFINIDTGASSLVLRVPRSSGCEIRSSSALSSRNFHGFDKSDEDTHRTENFDSSPNIIFIDIESGLSSITVKRYGKDEKW